MKHSVLKRTLLYRFGLILALAALISMLPMPAFAEIVQVVTDENADPVTASFYIRGKLIGTVIMGKDPDHFNARVENWKRRIMTLLEGKPDVKKIKAVFYRSKSSVVYDKTEIVSFTRDDAKLHKTTAYKLAQSWAGNLRAAVKDAPFIKIEENSVIVPLNENFKIPFEGKFKGELSFYDYDTTLINVTSDKETGEIIVSGLSLGEGMFTVMAEDVEKTIYFKVRERAAYIPQYMTLEVAGSPAHVRLIKEAFESVVKYRSAPKEGTFMIIGNPIKEKPISKLYVTNEESYIIPVKIDGPQYIAAITKVRLTVRNKGFERPDPSLLFVSNNPEVITKDGELFSTELLNGSPTRYFYHHRNAHNQPWRDFNITLKNDGPLPVKVFVSPVGAGPTSDEIFAGHLAASAFFDNRKDRAGWFVTIKPGSSYLLENRLAKTDHTISGVGYVDIVEGRSLKFICDAVTRPGGQPEDLNLPPVAEKPGVRTSKGVFPAYIKLNPVHNIGGKYTYIYLGGEPYSKDVKEGQPNYGNYGAFYDVDISIKNNREGERDAWVYFVPGGGMARGIFEVDGQLLETKLASPGQRILLKKVKVPEGGEEKVRIITMPQGGSFYPVKIVVESEFVKMEEEE